MIVVSRCTITDGKSLMTTIGTHRRLEDRNSSKGITCIACENSCPQEPKKLAESVHEDLPKKQNAASVESSKNVSVRKVATFIKSPQTGERECEWSSVCLKETNLMLIHCYLGHHQKHSKDHSILPGKEDTEPSDTMEDPGSLHKVPTKCNKNPSV